MTLWILLAYIVGAILFAGGFTFALERDSGGVLYPEDEFLVVGATIFWPVSIVFLTVYIAFSWTTSLIVNWLEGLMK